jgi:hypothetical protein
MMGYFVEGVMIEHRPKFLYGMAGQPSFAALFQNP